MKPAWPRLPNGAVRASFPFSERAMELYPDRFAYLVRIDPTDPELDRLLGEVRHKTGGSAMRLVPVPDVGEVNALANGEFEGLFAAAEKYQVPIFCWTPGRSHLLEPYLQRHPKLQVIVDHCGVGVAPPVGRQVSVTRARSVTERLIDRVKELDDVIQLGERFPNLSLKWCHAPAYLSEQSYPFRDAVGYLKRVIDAWGADRVMWASDVTVSRRDHYSWAESMHYLRDSDTLTLREQEWVLGGTVRKVLNWTAPERPA